MKKEKRSKALRLTILGMPLGGVAVASFLPLSQLSHQFLILIVLLWVQVFFLFDSFLVGH
jgi:hypothetical protein